MSRIVLMVCGSPDAPSGDLIRSLAEGSHLIVAVDAGADALLSAGITPDLLVGDSDSVSDKASDELRSRGVQTEIHPAHKDRTDLSLALDTVAASRPDEVWITGAGGGRPDHFLAVAGAVARSAELRPSLIESGYRASVVSATARQTYTVEGESSTFSVIAPLGPAVVSISGAEWPLDHATLLPLDDRGVSNTVAGASTTVTVHEGIALVFVPAPERT